MVIVWPKNNSMRLPIVFRQPLIDTCSTSPCGRHTNASSASMHTQTDTLDGQRGADDYRGERVMLPQVRGGEGTVDWNAVGSNCSIGSCLFNSNKRIKLEQLKVRNLSTIRVSNRIIPPSKSWERRTVRELESTSASQKSLETNINILLTELGSCLWPDAIPPASTTFRCGQTGSTLMGPLQKSYILTDWGNWHFWAEKTRLKGVPQKVSVKKQWHLRWPH